MRVEKMEKRRIKKKRQSHQRKRVTKKRREGMKMKMRMKIMQSSPITTTQGAPPEQHKLINRKNILDLVTVRIQMLYECEKGRSNFV